MATRTTKSATKTTAAKKTAAKKSPVAKAKAAPKTKAIAAKKPATKKTVASKTTAAKKPAAKPAAAKKTPAKKPAAKKTTAKAAVAKKPAAKTTATKKPAAKTATKKPAQKSKVVKASATTGAAVKRSEPKKTPGKKTAAKKTAKKPASRAASKKGADDAKSGDGPILDMSDSSVKKLIKKAKARGYVTYDELNEVMPSEEVSSEQIEDVMSMLSDMGINVVDEDDVEEVEAATPAVSEGSKSVLKTATKPEPTERTDDPVRMYLREMGTVDLLSREGEIAIAKRIEAGREAMIAGLCESPLTFQAIIIWHDELMDGKIQLVCLEWHLGFAD